MRRVGFSYMIVTYHPPVGDQPGYFQGDDQCRYRSEPEMLRELGTTCWELLFIRETGGAAQYYFKRPRA